MIYVLLVFLSSILAHEEEYTKETIVTKIKGVYQAEPLCKAGSLQENWKGNNEDECRGMSHSGKQGPFGRSRVPGVYQLAGHRTPPRTL